MTTDTLTLTAFLLARIAEDEEVARAAASSTAAWGEVWHKDAADSDASDWIYIYDERWGSDPIVSDRHMKHEVGVHIARHDPARVLAECEAKRRIVEEHGVESLIEDNPLTGAEHRLGECETCGIVSECGCPTIQLLALPYADHPDYREEWRL